MAETQLTNFELIKKGAKDAGINPGKLAKNGMTIAFLAIIAVVGIMAVHYILPYLIDIVWGTLELAVGGIIGIVIFSFCVAQWKNFRLWNEMMANKVFDNIVSKAPFMMQEKKISRAEQDIDKMITEKEKIRGTYVNLITKLNKNKQAFEEAAAGIVLARQQNRKDMESSAVSAQIRAQNYITAVEPVAKNIKFLIDFVDDASKVLKRRLKDSKADLEQNRDIYESVTAGAKGLLHLREAIVGDVQLNSDAERATVAAGRAIALSIGQITTSMEIIQEFTSNANFEDASKVLAARTKLEQLQIVGVNTLPEPTSMFEGITKLKVYGADEFPIN